MNRNYYQFFHNALSLSKLELLQRYKRSILGLWWSLFNPLMTITIYFLAFSQLIIIEKYSEDEYLIYLISGVIIVNFSVQAMISVAETFAVKINLITRIKVDPFLLGAGVLFSSLLNFIIIFFPLILLIFFNHMLSVKFLFVLFLILCLSFFLYSIGLLLALLFTLFDDIKAMIRICFSFAPFVTPVFYSLDQLPKSFATFVLLNPLTSFLSLFRWTIGFNTKLEPFIFIHLFICLIFAFICLIIFRRKWGRLVKSL